MTNTNKRLPSFKAIFYKARLTEALKGRNIQFLQDLLKELPSSGLRAQEQQEVYWKLRRKIYDIRRHKDSLTKFNPALRNRL